MEEDQDEGYAFLEFPFISKIRSVIYQKLFLEMAAPSLKANMKLIGFFTLSHTRCSGQKVEKDQFKYILKRDIWALYRNWSSDWNALTTGEEIHKYDMVEVLDDYNELKGVTVAPLVKLPGFKTVLRKNSCPSKTRVIPKKELFRLSHQVPSRLLTGQEGENAPKGCLELDPAATLLELLQALTEVEVEEMKEDQGKSLGRNC
ncbi:hypothetical protein PTKIN_Ptkin04bG0027400 [Pterospermum kingtungense]